jgi:Acetyltransferases
MLTVRPARLPDDKPAILDFIWGLQRYEAEFEHDRRLDPAYGEDQYTALMKRAGKGVIFIAEAGSQPVGWVLVIEQESPAYVIPEEKLTAYICELYVAPEARGMGAGRALMVACEGWSRARGHRVIHIGHLAQNRLAEAVYDKAGYAPYVVSRRKKL